jgi:PiT family inorganic phosphate transporter
MESLFIDPTLILIIAAFAGFFMAFGIGANDVANAMGTSVGSKAITFKQAIFIAAIFEFLGAYLAGGEVTSTIRKGLVDPNLYVGKENIFIQWVLKLYLGAKLGLLLLAGLYHQLYLEHLHFFYFLVQRNLFLIEEIHLRLQLL